MPYNGSNGTFSRLFDWTDDRDANIKIRADRFDQEMDGFATGLSTAICKDGQTTPTANLPMGTFRHTGVGNAQARTDYAAAGQVQDGSFIWCGTAGGSKNALTLTPTPAITAYAAGQAFKFKAGSTASDDAVTVAISGLATKAIERDDVAMSATNVIEANKYYEILYDGVAFQIEKVSDTEGLVAADITGQTEAVITVSDKIVFSDTSDGGNLKTDEIQGLIDAIPLPRNHIAGLKLTVGTDTDHDVDIAAGECRDIGNSHNMLFTGTTTIAIDASAGINSISTGTVAADTGYGVWAWEDSTAVATPVRGFTFDTVMNPNGSPTAPSGYDKKRLIGWVLTDSSSNIISFIQSGDYFRLMGDIAVVVTDATITGGTFETATLPVPPLSEAKIYGHLENTTSASSDDGRLFIKTKGAGDAFTATEAWVLAQTSGNFDRIGNEGEVLVDSNSQIEYTSGENSGSATVTISLIGCNLIGRSQP